MSTLMKVGYLLFLLLNHRSFLLYTIDYTADDFMVPKNASVIAQRVPVKHKNLSLRARIENRGYAAPVPETGDIIMPTLPEKEIIIPAAVESHRSETEDALALMAEEASELKRTAPLSMTSMRHVGGGMMGRGPNGGRGHHRNNITLPDRLINVPKSSVQEVHSIEGVDTNTTKVIQREDGKFLIFKPSETGLQQLSTATYAVVALIYYMKHQHLLIKSFFSLSLFFNLQGNHHQYRHEPSTLRFEMST